MKAASGRLSLEGVSRKGGARGQRWGPGIFSATFVWAINLQEKERERERQKFTVCVCECFPAIFGQKLLARNYGKYIKFLAKEVTGSWGAEGRNC